MNETLIPNINETAWTIASNFSLIQTIDPNWLYSSIAQCSAAIVGLMGALLVSKMMNQKSFIKNLENEIHEKKATITYLKESIKEKEEWVAKIDYEEDVKTVNDFLSEVEDRIDPISPPDVTVLLEWAKESINPNFHNLNEDILKKNYNAEYIENVRAKRKAEESPFRIFTYPIPQVLISPQISSEKWARYGRYIEEIRSTKYEISYLGNLLETKNKQLEVAEESLEIRDTWKNLAIFSILGVFVPLFFMALDPVIEYNLRFFVLFVMIAGWLLMLKHLILEIRDLKKDDIDATKK